MVTLPEQVRPEPDMLLLNDGPPLEKVTLLKLFVPRLMTWFALPLKWTVAEPPVSVPPAVKLPPTVRVVEE
jgi:hypothetical protein